MFDKFTKLRKATKLKIEIFKIAKLAKLQSYKACKLR